MNRILVIRLSAIGDVLLTTPLLRMLKKRFPNAEIDFLVKQIYEPLIRTNRHIRRVYSFSHDKGLSEIWRQIYRIRAIEYDAIIDLQTNFRSWLFRTFSKSRRRLSRRPQRWRRFLLVHFRKFRNEITKPIPLRYLDAVSSLGVKDDGLGLELIVEEDANRSVLSKVKTSFFDGDKRIVALAPGAAHPTKRWPAERFAGVGNHLIEGRNQVVLVGGDEDQAVCREVENRMDALPVNLAGRLSLQETAAVLNKSILLISNDTGVMHMGAALGKPVVAIFGPTSRHLGFFPFRTRSLVVERPVSCRPCSYHGTITCPRGHFQCMEQIPTSDVIRAAEALLMG